MRTVHLLFAATLLVILTPYLSFGQNQANLTNSIPPTVIRTLNDGCVTSLQTTVNGSKVTIHYGTGVNVTGKSLPPGPGPLPKLATINVASNKTESSPIVITGTVYKPSSRITLIIESPRENIVQIAQLHPSPSGAFSFKLVPTDPLWSCRGNYTATLLSGSQVLGSTSFYFNGTNNRSIPFSMSQIHVVPSGGFRNACNAGFELILKVEDGSSVCVRPATAQILMERGWARQIINLQISNPANPVSKEQTIYAIYGNYTKVHNNAEASAIAGFDVKFPRIFSDDYRLQLAVVKPMSDHKYGHAYFFFSKNPILSTTTLYDFSHAGGIMAEISCKLCASR